MREIELDRKDYREGSPVFLRKAVRGIIRRGDKYLVIVGKYGDCKFPGGGMKPGETLADTLKREVREETGYQVMEESAENYLLVHEKRCGEWKDILQMDSWYYFCDAAEEVTERDLDDYEKEYEYRVHWLTIEEMIAQNEKATDCTKIPWAVRELFVMKLLQELQTISE